MGKYEEYHVENYNTTDDYKYYRWKTGRDIQTNSKDDFWVIVKYDQYTSAKIQNKAYFYPGLDYNSTRYRTVDYDYIIMDQHKVSLEKFVSQVTDKNGQNKVDYDRDGYRYNNSLEDGDINKNMQKPNNPVELEAGDKITYTIRLTNTGDLPVKIDNIYDYFTDQTNGLKLEYDNSYGVKLKDGDNLIDNFGTITEYNPEIDDEALPEGFNRYLIDFNTDNKLNNKGDYIDVLIRFNVSVPSDLSTTSQKLINKAEIVSISDENGNPVDDSDGTNNNADEDHVITKTYAVSLEKFVSKVNGQDLQSVNANVAQREGKAEHDYDEDTNTNNSWKYNNIVTVSKGDKVTYTIKVKNDGNTNVYITDITDYLPDGVKYNGQDYKGNQYDTTTDNAFTFNTFDNLKDILAPGEEARFTIDVEVIEPNISLNILKNTAKIGVWDKDGNKIESGIKNRNEIVVEDTTPNNNTDSDYIKLDFVEDPDPDSSDIVISGNVWNDRAFDKTKNEYNGIYDSEESALKDIKVMLYRKDVSEPIATKYTDDNGYYSFANTDIDTNVVKNTWERYIKAPTNKDNNRWNDEGTYYSYYVVFEYDGITYTSTTLIDDENVLGIKNDTYNDSNAQEDLDKRTTFNNKFSTINNDSRIEYTTKNEEGYIPQSNYIYDSETMAIQSSTNQIELSNSETLETQLKHVNLGLRGRDVFDLELISNVDNVKVTVNGHQGVYNYSNKVTLRKSDINQMPVPGEDMANISSESSNTYVDRQDQKIRTTDIKNNYKDDTGLGIEVTYKITVTNASQTDGTATKITNYYDNKYSINKDKGKIAYYYNDNNQKTWIDAENIKVDTSEDAYNSIVITTPGTNLTQSATMDIYVVYTLNDASTTLSSLLEGKALPTYNMAEITEYKTQCGANQTEYTRGLIDKDSAPGSANKEQVRTTETEGQNTPTTEGRTTTVEYYFGGNDLTKLKYEDDTYATPTLYFVSGDSQRTIEGTVFEDDTQINKDLIKSGNGIKDGIEPTIQGITVELYEDGQKVTQMTTDEKGLYKFEGLLPGNYYIKYYYGDTDKTFLKKSPNEKSYNGEDFQATNNSYDVEDIDVNKLSTRKDYWYLDNEDTGVSTAKDDTERRNGVTDSVIKFKKEEMENLNKVRENEVIKTEEIYDIVNKDDIDSLIEKTYMYANTASMLLNVEKTEKPQEPVTFGDYTIKNMNFGIAGVPVTRINLQKEVAEFTITDSTGQNIMARAGKEIKPEDEQGAVLFVGDEGYKAEIEDAKLQGARLQIKYNIRSNPDIERNFDGEKGIPAPTINGLIDIIDNNLSYNPNLNDNDKNWDIKTEKLEETSIDNISNYSTIVEATSSAINEINAGKEITITLEQVLSSTDATISDIITSNKEVLDPYVYDNIVEITELDYTNVTSGEPTSEEDLNKDRIRTTDDYTILAGKQYDTAESATISIIPPWGGLNYVPYYIIAVISLGVLVAGVFGVRKVVLSNKK